MEQITHYTTLLKGILDANPWIWHVIQVFLLLVFFMGMQAFKEKINYKIVAFLNMFKEILILSILFLYGKMIIWGFFIYLTIFFIDTIFKKKKILKIEKLTFIWEILRVVLISSIIFSINEELILKYKITLLIIWIIYIQQIIFISFNDYKYSKKHSSTFGGGLRGGFIPFFSPKLIALALIPFSWYIWVMVFLILFEPEISNEPYPEFYLRNKYTLIDNWKDTSHKNKLFFLIAIFIIFYLGFNINSFLLLGLIKFILNKYPAPRYFLSNPMESYDSYSLITGNYNYLHSIVTSNKLLLLVQRISIKLSDKFTYGILVSPYEEVVVKHNLIKNINELAPFSHHLILMDGGENSDKIIKIERDLNYFLGRVDSVIDFFTIDNQSIDVYSKSINEDYAQSIRNRIAVKQSIIDEKSIELIENTNEESITIDRFINSINTESVRINMLVREYYKDTKIDYNQLQTELINKGPFEINTLLRQMREGGSIPSRFVDALSISEVSARYLFSLINEVNNYLDKNEDSIQERNTKYAQLSFGPCVGFLRTISEKGKLNAFEKSIKKVLKTKYTDSENCQRLKKYLITDLHYDKDVKEEPTLFDLFNYMAYIRNKTRGHGTPSKVEFEFYVTLDLISIFIVHCISKIQVETFSKQVINDKEWLLYYNAGGNVILHPLNPDENLEYWKDSFDWKYLDKMEDAKKHIQETNQSVYLKIKYQEEIHWIKAETYFKCKVGIIYMYDGINKDEAEWISFTTGAVIRPYRIN